MKKLSFLLTLFTVGLSSCDQNSTTKLDSSNSDKTRIGLSVMDSINEVIKANPNDGNLYFERAQIHFFEKDLASSLSDVGRALSIDSNNIQYLLLLADLKLLNKQSRESKEILLKANRIEPENIDVLIKLGELYMIVQDADASFTYLNKALKLDVFNSRIYQLKGFNYKFLKDTLNAVSSFQTAVEQNPKDYDSYFQLGLFYADINDPLAEDYFNNAIKVRPQSLEARYAKGLHFQEMEKTREALDCYKEIIDLNPNYFNAYYNRGYVYLLQIKDQDSAAYEFQRAIDFGPKDYYEAYYNLGVSKELSGNPTEAIQAFKTALKINPQYDLAAKGLERLVDKKK